MKKPKIIQKLLIFWFAVFLFLGHAQTGLTFQKDLPQRVILNLTSKPHNSQAVTWRTIEKKDNPRAQIIRVSNFSNALDHIKTYPAKTDPVDLDKKTTIFHHSVIFSELEPDILYAYRVGDNGLWSEWNQFRTATQNNAAFTFLYFGDIQNHIWSMCSQIFRTAFKKKPDAKFWLFAGDIVNNGKDDNEWRKVFNALGWIPRTTPVIPVAGNHEYPYKRFTLKKNYKIPKLWNHHFTLPENGPSGLEETVFYFEYQGALFIILNGNEQIEKQAQWLNATLAKNKLKWIIVSLHQPLYITFTRKENLDFKKYFTPLFDKFSVDLVLQGHDHSYSRTFPLKNHLPVKGSEKGTIYIISVAGPKFYPFDSRNNHLMAKTGIQKQLFQSITLNKNKLHYISYNLSGEVFDTFEIIKKMDR